MPGTNREMGGMAAGMAQAARERKRGSVVPTSSDDLAGNIATDQPSTIQIPGMGTNTAQAGIMANFAPPPPQALDLPPAVVEAGMQRMPSRGEWIQYQYDQSGAKGQRPQIHDQAYKMPAFTQSEGGWRENQLRKGRKQNVAPWSR